MSTARGRTWAALVAATLVLVGTVGAAVAVAGTNGFGDTSQQSLNARSGEHRFAGQWPMMADRVDNSGSMMGARSYGMSSMMGTGWAGWSDHRMVGSGPVTAPEASLAAQRWLARYAPSAQLGDRTPMPMGFRFLASENGSLVAMIMVDDDTGTVTGRVRGPATSR